MANGKKKEARGHVALECTECKENVYQKKIILFQKIEQIHQIV